jgi:hypothetical protein
MPSPELTADAYWDETIGAYTCSSCVNPGNEIREAHDNELTDAAWDRVEETGYRVCGVIYCEGCQNPLVVV